MATEKTINGHDYRIGKLNVIQQFNVAKRLAPVLAGLAGTIQKAGPIRTAGDAAKMMETTNLEDLITPITTAVSSLTDEQSDYVINTCMSVVHVRQGEANMQGSSWASAWNKASNSPMFTYIELPEMLQLVVAVITENMAGFMPALPQQSMSDPQLQSGQ